MATCLDRQKSKKPDTPDIGKDSEVSIRIPSRLAERVEKYAEENGMSMMTVLVEAIDEYLRNN